MKQFMDQDRKWEVYRRVDPQILKAVQSPPPGCAAAVQENKVRASFFLNTGNTDLPVVFVKRYKPGPWIHRLKYLLVPPKAKQEWTNLCLFQKKGITCPEPLAFSVPKGFFKTGSSFLVTAAIQEAIPLNTYLEKNADIDFAEKLDLSKRLGAQVRQMHEHGVYYRDLHAGNILIKDTASKQIFFTDLHRAFCLPLLPDLFRIKDVAKLCASLSVSASLKTAFLQSYCQDEKRFRLFFKKAATQAQRIQQKHIQSRSKRCVKNSSLFEVKKGLSTTYCGRRRFGYQQTLDLITRHKQAVASQNAELVKQTPKSALTVHRTRDGSMVAVKGDRQHIIKRFFTASRAMKSWKASHRLSVRGVNTPEALSVVEKSQDLLFRESFLLTAWIKGAAALNDYISETGFDHHTKRKFIQRFAGILRRLHQKGIYHADLKSNNILVCDPADAESDVYFIDLDRVYFQKKLTRHQQINNLAQINASVSNQMTPKDRLRFFYFYMKKNISKPLRKQYYNRILEISRSKVTAPYGVIFD